VATKHLHAYRQIKLLIEGGHLKPGERVTEAKVAKMVGVGRGPVRESLMRLQAEGLLRHKASWRSRVVAYTEDQNPQEMLRRYELREDIESGAARLAAANMTGLQIRRLRRLAQRVNDAKESNDRQAMYDAAEAFHEFLLANCGNPLFLEVWQTHRLVPTQPRSPELEALIQAQMPEGGTCPGTAMEVANAIADRDPDRAQTLMKCRVRSITEALRNVLGKTDGH
jgi:DNA-binding GntR family transcriptional regulator